MKSEKENEKSRNLSTAEAEINALASSFKSSTKLSSKTTSVFVSASPAKNKTPVQVLEKGNGHY